MHPWVKAARKRAAERMFHTFQSVGLDVLPRHFYSEIPDIAKLRRSTDWRRAYSMIGVSGNDVDVQLSWLERRMTCEVRAWLADHDVHVLGCQANGAAGYGRVEADVLHGVIRAEKPQRIVQIGSGVSTAIILDAAAHADYEPYLLAIDPFPTEYLREAAAKGVIQLWARPAESVDPDSLTLAAGDLFFVDSTHTLGPAGEVGRIVLEILPRLASGVLVHFHDIYFPYDYPSDVLEGAVFFPHESPLLHAFLVNNSRFEILASLSMLHHQRPAELARLVESYSPRRMCDGLSAGGGHLPSALYLSVGSGER